MKPLHLTLAATAALLVGAGGAAAQSWRDFDGRLGNLEDRIERGAALGELTRGEARELLNAVEDLDDLEDRYQIGGYSAWEREDLDGRIDALSRRLGMDRTDYQVRDRAYDDDDWGPGRWYRDGVWAAIDERKDELDRRIDRGVETGDITAGEAVRLREEFRDIASLELRYSSGGLSQWEREDLDRRFDDLARQIRWDRSDWDRYSG
ncbi:MAG TPA: hypothetical protein VEA79_13840 [Phenylobacterium sp.]|nr:hypothetical protein [Phenylobacterium sp.]